MKKLFGSLALFAACLGISPALFAAELPSQVAVIGYHRFENPAKDPLAIPPEQFRKQMQEIKDAGIPVISMDDFLAWRKGEKTLPEKSVIITIDDGYNCTYHHAWPILKEFGYPFTFYVYSGYIGTGGRAVTWDQLAQLRDAGVDIGGHSVSHDNLIKPRRVKPDDYDGWLANEFSGIKDLLKEKLGIEAKTFAYPYGIQNEKVRQAGTAAGYQALFTVSGKKVTKDTPAAEIGRYVVQSDKPQTFSAALHFGASQMTPGSKPAGASVQTSGPSLEVTPAHGSTIADDRPEISLNLSGIPDIDPKSIEMRISGIGQVPANFDPVSSVVSYRPTQRLHAQKITVQVKAKSGKQRTDTAWEFFRDPSASSMAEMMMEPPKETKPAKPSPGA